MIFFCFYLVSSCHSILDVVCWKKVTKGAILMNLPKDPVILLSYVNTQLRDYYESLEALCTCRGLNRESLLDKMDSIDYHYDEETNQFI